MNDPVNRRSFFTLNWDATVGFMKNILAPQLEQERNFFRPPGADDELQFLTSCSRCGKCKEICPENIIKLFSYNSGVKKAYTPYINPNESPCTFCEKCIDICPTDALSQNNLKENPSIGHAFIRTDICMAYHGTLCDYCVRACPVDGALNLDLFKPVLNLDYCTGCGLCASHCINESQSIYIQLQK